MAGLSYFYESDWRILVGYFMAVPTLLIFIPNFFVLETPRYYMDKDPKKVVR